MCDRQSRNGCKVYRTIQIGIAHCWPVWLPWPHPLWASVDHCVNKSHFVYQTWMFRCAAQINLSVYTTIWNHSLWLKYIAFLKKYHSCISNLSILKLNTSNLYYKNVDKDNIIAPSTTKLIFIRHTILSAKGSFLLCDKYRCIDTTRPLKR